MNLEARAKRCFPQMTFESETTVWASIDNEYRPLHVKWNYFAAKLFNDDGQLVAEGEHLASERDCYESLLNILQKLPAPYPGSPPVKLGSISDYSGLRCSACGLVRPCMLSASDWSKEIAGK